MLQYESLDDIKLIILQNEIESFRRKSYIEQFEDLESRFSIKLKAFRDWPAFVECAQRRNLIAHCDGVISDQYMTVCKKQGHSFDAEVRTGDKLGISPEYFRGACRMVRMVGLMLCQTLWRKVLPDELEEADKELNDNIYNLLIAEKWKTACEVGEFAKAIPNISDPVQKRMIHVNYVIALKFGGHPEAADEALNAMNWADTSNDFKLAHSVLSGNYDRAVELMHRIGVQGDYIRQHSYHVWPVFRDFRQTEAFLHAYEDIYKFPFAVELQRSTDKTIAESEVQMVEKKHDLDAASDAGEALDVELYRSGDKATALEYPHVEQTQESRPLFAVNEDSDT